jgi:hypothetical protein
MLIEQILYKINISLEKAEYIVDSAALSICKTIYSNRVTLPITVKILKVGFLASNYTLLLHLI